MQAFKSCNFLRFSFLLYPVLATLVILPGLGCGSGSQDDQAMPDPAPASRAMVPQNQAAVADSVMADSEVGQDLPTTETPGTAAALETGTSSPTAGHNAAAGEAVSPPRPTITHTGGSYSLQLGSFGKIEGAERRVAALRTLGYAPVIETATVTGQTYHRVFLRGLPDQAAAEALGEQLRSEMGITYLIRRRDG